MNVLYSTSYSREVFQCDIEDRKGSLTVFFSTEIDRLAFFGSCPDWSQFYSGHPHGYSLLKDVLDD